MKVLVCGDRDWTNRKKIKDRLDDLWNEPWDPENTEIIHGAARGADSLAAEIAKKVGFNRITSFPADWNKHGKSAGPIRNRQMLDEEPDLVIAFHSNIKKSKGTKDCIEEANRRGIRVEIIP